MHFDDNGGDMSTYPKEFKTQVYIVAYGIVGLTDHVNPEVYDAHEAFEIDKTKMKMLVPLDMNGKQLMNVNYDLKFGNLFKIIKCYASSLFSNTSLISHKKSDNMIFTTATPIVTHSINLYKYRDFGRYPRVTIAQNGKRTRIIKNIEPPTYSPSTGNANEYCFDIPMMCVFSSGILVIYLKETGKTRFDVDLIVSYL